MKSFFLLLKMAMTQHSLLLGRIGLRTQAPGPFITDSNRVSQTHWEPRPELDIDLNSVTSESRGLGSRRRARWLKAPADRRQIVPLRASLSESFLSKADSYNWGPRRINTSFLVHL